jgi:hypothetical protein
VTWALDRDGIYDKDKEVAQDIADKVLGEIEQFHDLTSGQFAQLHHAQPLGVNSTWPAISGIKF